MIPPMDLLYDPADAVPPPPDRTQRPRPAPARNTLAATRRINVQSLAADLVLFGADDLPGVMSAHKLDEEQLASLLETNAALRARVRDLKKQVESDPKAMIRLRAAGALEGHIATLNLLAADAEIEPKDRRACIELLAELADAMPKVDKATAATGVVLQMNFGAGAPPPSIPQPVNRMAAIEHD